MRTQAIQEPPIRLNAEFALDTTPITQKPILILDGGLSAAKRAEALIRALAPPVTPFVSNPYRYEPAAAGAKPTRRREAVHPATTSLSFALTVYATLTSGVIMTACGITGTVPWLTLFGFLTTTLACVLQGWSLCEET